MHSIEIDLTCEEEGKAACLYSIARGANAGGPSTSTVEELDCLTARVSFLRVEFPRGICVPLTSS